MECKNALRQEDEQHETREMNGYCRNGTSATDDAQSQTCRLPARNHDQCICTNTGCNRRRQGMFYAQLDTILTAIPESEKIFLLGDFNARVGRSADVWTGVIGRHGVGNVNDNGILLLSKCAEHRLLITNTTFCLKDKHKTSWMHPRSKHWHLLDYVIIRQRDQADVLSTRAMAGSTACSTDHRLIRAKVAIRIAPKHRKQQTSRRKLDVGILKDFETSNQFKRDLEERLL